MPPASPLPPSFMAGAAIAAPFPAENRAAYSVYDPVLFEMLEVDAREFAEQMTLVDASYFAKIQASELLSLAWTAADKWERAPNVVTFTQRFNNMTLWVCHEVLESTNPRRRAEKITHFINIAKGCYDLNNLNGLKSILAGLQSTPVHRLAKTWALVKSKDKATFDKLSELMASDSNSERYRKRLMSCKTAAIPFLGLHLSDLTFVSEAGKATTDRQEREAQMRTMVEMVLSFQGVKYESLRPLPAAAEFLSSPKFIAELLPFYEQENYRISLALEPKEGTTPAPLGGAAAGTTAALASPRESSSASPASTLASSVPSETSGRGFFGAATGFWRSSRSDDSGGAGSGRNDLQRNGSGRRPESAVGGGAGGRPPETPLSAVSGTGAPRRMVNLLDDSDMPDSDTSAGSSATPITTPTAAPSAPPAILVSTTAAASSSTTAAIAVPAASTARTLGVSHSISATPITDTHYGGGGGYGGDSGSDGDGSDHDGDAGGHGESVDARSWAVGGRLLPGVPIQLEGRLVKKDLSLNWKRARHRSWNAYWAVLQHPYLLLFKDRGSTIRSTRDVAAKHVLELTAASFADVASDYKKRRHVFRLMPVPGTEMLFEARTDDDMDAWLHALEQCVHKLKHPTSQDMISMGSESHTAVHHHQ